MIAADSTPGFAAVFAEVIDRERGRSGRLKKELAHICGIRPDRLSHLVNGRRTPGSREEVLKMARGLHLNEDVTNRLLRAAGLPEIASRRPLNEIEERPLSQAHRSVEVGARLVVRSEAPVSGDPDQLELTFRLAVKQPSADGALAEVSRISSELKGLLLDVGVSEGVWTTSGISLREIAEQDNRSQPASSYEALRHIVIRLAGRQAQEPAVCSSIISHATSLGLTVIERRWSVGSDNPARLDACRRAAISATRKAETYASGLGVRLGPLISAQERVDNNTDSSIVQEAGLDERFKVHAIIEVTFQIESMHNSSELRFMGPVLE